MRAQIIRKRLNKPLTLAEKVCAVPTSRSARAKGKGRSLGQLLRRRLGAPSRTQIVYGHLDDPETSGLERGVTYLKLRPGAAFRAPARRDGLSPA